jgi:hypothetical protein
MKPLSFFLAITIIFFTLPVYSLKIIPDDMSGKPGDEIQIPIKIFQLDKKIEAFGTVFSFNPEILTFKGISKVELTQEFDFLEAYEYSPGFIRIAGISRIPIQQRSEGVLFGMNFKVKNAAAPGKYALTFADSVANGELSSMQFASTESGGPTGKLNSAGMPPFMPGKDLGFFIWFNPDNDTWNMSFSVNNTENKGEVFTDDLQDAITQPAFFTVLTSAGDKITPQSGEDTIHGSLYHIFSGFVQSDSEITSFSQEGMEPNDKVQMVGKDKIVFVTSEEIFNDTLVFKTNGTKLTFELKLDGEFLPKKIFIGAYKKNPNSAQFTIEKPENSSFYYIKPGSITLEN